ncbi:MAG TPA: glycosyltransferase [Trichormus sp.]
MQGSLISIVLPVRDQGEHIGRVVEAYRSALSKQIVIPSEIVLVTNNGNDGSHQLCQEIADRYQDVKAIHVSGGGWGRSIRMGLKSASGDLLCYTNSARTSPDVLIAAIKYGISNPNSVIKANRKIRDNWRRRLGSVIYNLECRAFFDLPTWDINGTPKIFPRSFTKLLELTSDDDLIDAEFSAVCRRAPYPVLEVPVVATKRLGGSSMTSYGSALKMYWGAFRLWLSMQQQPSR